MATPKKKKTARLEWKPYPKGGEYTNYKLGLIVRLKGSYSVKIGRASISVKTLKDAKTIIDAYTATRIKYHKK